MRLKRSRDRGGSQAVVGAQRPGLPTTLDDWARLSHRRWCRLLACGVRGQTGGRREPTDDLGRITCGDNPHLYARLVDGRDRPLGPARTASMPCLLWVERPLPPAGRE